MSVRADILKTLAATNNAAAERALEAALQVASGREQAELADVLITRNRRPGWVALIRAYHKLDPQTQEKVLSRPRDLFGPLAETLREPDGPGRQNVVAIVQRCTDVRLVYLLAEALMDSRPEVRAIAGNSLLEAVRRHWKAAHPAPGTPDTCLPPLEDGEQLRKAVETGLRQFKNHRQSSALLAALIHERRQDADLWLLFQDPYDERARAATVILRAPTEPALAAAVLLGLGSSLKSACVAGLAGIELPAVATAVARESFRLLDPVLREPAQGITHLKMLPALRRELPWNLTNWSSWLRLIELLGLQPAEKLTWLVRLLESAPPGWESRAWRICTARAIAATQLAEAAVHLAALACDPDEAVARCAGRFLLNRRQPAWRERAEEVLCHSPHASVRRLLAYSHALREPVAAPVSAPTAAAAVAAPLRSFNKTWADFQKLPPAVQRTAMRTMATDPKLTEQLRAKFQGSPADIAQALRMVSALPNLTPYRMQIIALCGHSDVRIAAQAIHLVGRLEDPKVRELLEAATHHIDARVRANAIEAMDDLHIADRSQQVLAMLNSRHNRERANAIKALGHFDFATARECLGRMLSDPNPLHRMSALWVVNQLHLLETLRQISTMSRRDPNAHVRKRAAEMLETLSGTLAALS
jgi:hypothetical protein